MDALLVRRIIPFVIAASLVFYSVAATATRGAVIGTSQPTPSASTNRMQPHPSLGHITLARNMSTHLLKGLQSRSASPDDIDDDDETLNDAPSDFDRPQRHQFTDAIETNLDACPNCALGVLDLTPFVWGPLK